ncbi:MAG: hypothetical protein JNK75_02470 [Betaproteobacteria bacterium]|nr:hypothetical protein [Betaproteobacteria bacterium]
MHALALVGVALALLVLAAVAAIALGAARWSSGTATLRAELDATREPHAPAGYDPRDIEVLPPPVKRYLRAALTPGQHLVAAVHLSHAGQFNMGEAEARWKPFKSTQLTVTRRPGFDWDGRIAMAPGLNACVHDAYVAGEGRLHAAFLGWFTLVDQRGTPELASGELMRFLAETPWYPTALLPGQGVRWEALDDRSARATLTDGATTVSLDFRFDADGLIASVRSPARHRSVGDKTVLTPWVGRFWNYEDREGMRVPREGEVAWEMAEGLRPYWRGHLDSIAFEFAQQRGLNSRGGGP